jgi:4-amino-4-deoxy-L-arabinose transferase-like glycosyltransferase
MVRPGDPLAPTSTTPRATDGLLLAACSLALYVLLGQGTFYKVDGQALLALAQQGQVHHPYHTFYLGLLALLRLGTAPLGFGAYASARLLSALGTAIGVLLIHRATRSLGLGRTAGNLAAAAFAVTPCVVFFATVVEVHGPFLAFAGIAALALARCARTLAAADAVLAGAGLGIAYLAHPSGALMGGLLPALVAIAQDSTGRRARLAAIAFACAIAAVAALAFIVLALPLLRSYLGASVDPALAAGFWLNFGTGKLLDATATVKTIAWEWLVPMLPMSLLALGALWWRGNRTAAILLLAGLLPYCLGAQLMLAGYSERGAYLLPAAWPTALVALAWCSAHRARVLLIVVAAGIAVAQVKLHDDPARARRFAQGVLATARGVPGLLITGDQYDVGACLMHLPQVPQFFVGLAVGLSDEAAVDALNRFEADVKGILDAGQAVLLTDAAQVELEQAAKRGTFELSVDPPVEISAPAAESIRARLEQAFVRERVESAGFTGYRLTAR